MTLTDPAATAAQVYGDRFDLIDRFANLLRGDGITRGLLGPREADRIWDRHILNCAAIGTIIPQGVRVADIGSGAGLPGLPVAILRPDLHITLVEPLLRRSTFLTEAVELLGLEGQVEVVRARAEDLSGVGYDVVTSRALAPLDKLVAWCRPLLAQGGEILALKGQSAAEEFDRHADTVRRQGLVGEVQSVRLTPETETTTLVRLRLA